MIPQKLLLTIPLLSLVVPSSAFSPTRSSSVMAFASGAHWRQNRPSTCLFAEEAEEGTTEKESNEEHPGDHTLPDESSSDILNSPAFLRRKLDVIMSDMAKAEEELAEAHKQIAAGKEEWGAQMDALDQEYENMSNRMSEQSKSGDTAAIILVARKFLEVMDNYDRAFGAITAESDDEKEIEAAYKNTYKMILDTFESLGIKEVETEGTEFDYEVHQAVMQRASPDHEEGIVCEELAKGYVLGDQLIRAAMVSVAA